MIENSRFQSLAFDFRALDVFQAVYASAGMTDAARHLDMTQSAVSQAIARLEEKLGVHLFERQRPLVPTAAADELATHLTRLFANAREMETRVRGCADSVRTVVRVGMVDSFTATVGPKLIPRLRARTERLTVWSGISRNLENDLLGGKIDIMIGSRPLPGEKTVVSWPILREPYIIVLPERMAGRMAKSVAGSGRGVRLDDLMHNHTFVRYSLRSKIGADIEKYLQQVDLVPPRSLEFDGTEAAFAMVNGGLGWMISTPLCLIHGAGVEPGLTAVPLPKPPPKPKSGAQFQRTLYLLARKNFNEPLVAEIREQARQITQELIATRLKPLAPWAVELVKVG